MTTATIHGDDLLEVGDDTSQDPGFGSRAVGYARPAKRTLTSVAVIVW